MTTQHVFLAARYGSKAEAEEIAKELRKAGHKVVSSWHQRGSTGGSYAEATDEQLAGEASGDLSDLDKATCFVVLNHLGNKGSHGGKSFEGGYCFARGLPCAFTGDPYSVYDRHSSMFNILPLSDDNYGGAVVAWLDGLSASGHTNTAGRIVDACVALSQMLIEKNKSYGDSALNPTGIFAKGKASSLIECRLDDKLNRIRNAPEAFGEDVVQDLMGYLVLYKLAKEDEK